MTSKRHSTKKTTESENPARDTKSNIHTSVCPALNSINEWRIFYKAVFNIDLDVTTFNFDDFVCFKNDAEIIIINNRLPIDTILTAYTRYVTKVINVPTNVVDCRQSVEEWHCIAISVLSNQPTENELDTTLTLRECLLIDLKNRFYFDQTLIKTTDTIVCTGSRVTEKQFPHVGIIGTILIIDTVDILDDNNFRYFTIDILKC